MGWLFRFLSICSALAIVAKLPWIQMGSTAHLLPLQFPSSWSLVNNLREMSTGGWAQVEFRSPQQVSSQRENSQVGPSDSEHRSKTQAAREEGSARLSSHGDRFAPPSPKSGSDFDDNFLLFSTGFVVAGIFSKILVVTGMSVSVFHFLGEFSPLLVLQKYFGRSEKKLPQELWATCHVVSNFSPKSLNSVVQINELSQITYRTKLRTIRSYPYLTILNQMCSGTNLVLAVSSLVWNHVNMLTFHIY